MAVSGGDTPGPESSGELRRRLAVVASAARLGWELPYHLVGERHLTAPERHLFLRTVWTYEGLIFGCVSWYFLIGVGTGGQEYINTFLELLLQDSVWLIGVLVAFAIPVVPALTLATTYPLGSPLGHCVRGTAFPYQMAIMVSVLAIIWTAIDTLMNIKIG